MDRRKPIIAFDFKSKRAAKDFLALFSGQTLNVKIGMELFYASGPDFIKEVVAAGHDVFLDVKLYDIPNTVKNAASQLAQLGVKMVDVHASGGKEMMQAAIEGIKQGTPAGEESPLLIAVTQLTSRDDATNVQEQQLAVSQEESIIHLAKLAEESGLDGVVCSPLEAKKVKDNTRSGFLTITPGIRVVDEAISNDDQKRVSTPKKAAEGGSDYIVVGRPITKASQPLLAYQAIAEEWQRALKGENND